ncbi:MAG: hypothetical protein KJO40_06230 [Deltaproteobacteria bacterium]|nr:hypothetical protein [Deltaproteobacteria bacterium]NND30890.1 hypothetical protein [Myxococcales bacterium]MBT8464828.1 hypothetical protein [Deltaproteobacteria bacterium]NNK06442.1 hypothetical protein [Myxococcales bacterium]NNK44806.1 hypothetical protein [Myxococcales bacterium]
MNGFRWSALLIALWLPSTLASAQWDTSTEEGGYTGATTAPAPPPAPPGQMISDPAYPAGEETGKMKGWQPAAFTWSIGIGVPIALDVPRSVVRPGANIFFFGGADFGWFIIGGDFGLQWMPIDFGNGFTPPGTTAVLTGRRPLTRIYLSAPEVRFQIPGLKVVLPYITGSFDMNFWNFAETAVGCGYWYCSQYSVYRFTPGFTGKAGIAFNVKKSGVYIDLGFQYSLTGKGNFFGASQWWLAPYAGVLVRRRD